MIKDKRTGFWESGKRIGTWLLLAYVFCFLVSFLQDFLGRSPVLDARENLALSKLIATGQVAREPMYRAMLYPWLISFLPNPVFWAPVLGIFCHLINAWLCGIISHSIWQKTDAGWLAGALYVVYPVTLYFSVQILDITLGTTFFLASLYALLKGCQGRVHWLLLAGLFGGLAVLTRPNFLLPAFSFPFIAAAIILQRTAKWKKAIGGFLGIGFMLVASLLGQGFVNYRLAGEFRILPWQGAYNLYAANRMGANGKYFKQRVSFESIPEGMNPTRLESEFLYEQANQGKVHRTLRP